MIFDYDVKVIVMLCQFVENSKIKCDNYLEINELNQNFEIERIEKKEIESKSFILNKLYIINKSTKIKKEVYHINFLDWIDHSVPNLEKTFEGFMSIFYLISIKKEDKPLIVHCSAGVGRTGTFIAIYLLYNQINDQLKNNSDVIKFNVFNTVRQLKEMSVFLVKNETEFNFIHKFIYELLEREIFKE